SVEGGFALLGLSLANRARSSWFCASRSCTWARRVTTSASNAAIRSSGVLMAPCYTWSASPAELSPPAPSQRSKQRSKRWSTIGWAAVPLEPAILRGASTNALCPRSAGAFDGGVAHWGFAHWGFAHWGFARCREERFDWERSLQVRSILGRRD